MSHGRQLKDFKPQVATAPGWRPVGRFFSMLLGILFGGWLQASVAEAGSSALIVTGISPSEADAAQLLSLATTTKRLLNERGLPESSVEILHEKVTRDLVVQKLQAISTSTNDEFWLVLYGSSGRSRGGQPAFQVSGPRLTAADLKVALDAMPARQFVFVGTGDSGGFLPVLQGGRRTVLSATKEEGEPDQPRFSEAWVKSLGKNPKAPFDVVAAQAAADVDAAYTGSHLAQSEHSRLADPVTGKIMEPPFGVSLNVTNPPAASLKEP